MTEYVSREAAYKTLTEYYHHTTDGMHFALKEALSRVPAADVREVVRCKDCALWNARGIIDRRPAEPTKRMCANWQRRTESEDYCSIGEAWRVSGPNCGADMRQTEAGE